ncbi:hypothetical protein [Piscirickettsia salmonis]|uniref:hypothetical protein n=1 Tax=Piscirickettsia salmonis TaxID=1238 RepID=UPI0016624B47|nr:hypothetical protein [Piscirickettsia salmonis]QNR82673.1 hypothetical protein ICC15_19875 [Piscirickettsia salmonis]
MSKKGLFLQQNEKKRGAISVRVWDEELIPLIGEQYGFLKRILRKNETLNQLFRFMHQKGSVKVYSCF